MDYSALRQMAASGDVLIVRGGRLIRILTAESFSHVALLVWEADCGGLWVYEFVETGGYQAMPFSQWLALREGQAVFYGQAPDIVRAHPALVVEAAHAYRAKHPLRRWYGWLSLPKVWLSQLIGRRVPVRTTVCSTFVQHIWERAGYDCMGRTADPGDIAMECNHLIKIDTHSQGERG